MIITKTPFRVSLCGGGSDIPSFYEKHGGCVISMALNKYMYISIHPYFDKTKTVLKYSKTEIADNLEEIEHSYFKHVLKKFNLQGVEITTTADIPAGTGLGSSSSFSVGLYHTLYSYLGKYVSKERLAQEACRLEINELHQPIGKQDQYAAAYGGFNFYEFSPEGHVFVQPIIMNPDRVNLLGSRLMMFYTGDIRSASNILKEQSENITSGDKEKNQLEICKLTYKLKDALENNNLDVVGEILHESWMLKKSLASGISNSEIDKYYDLAINSGAMGGKLLGAGGGGFMLFYVKEEYQANVEKALSNLRKMDFGFDFQGSSVIYVGDHYIKD
jgi:D-glycero-alpha-D-manno-heptose-7-phosphate kinase